MSKQPKARINSTAAINKAILSSTTYITENYTNGYDAESYDEDFRKGFITKKG